MRAAREGNEARRVAALGMALVLMLPPACNGDGSRQEGDSGEPTTSDCTIDSITNRVRREAEEVGVTGWAVMATEAGIVVYIPEEPDAADSIAEDVARRCPEVSTERGPPIRPVGYISRMAVMQVPSLNPDVAYPRRAGLVVGSDRSSPVHTRTWSREQP